MSVPRQPIVSWAGLSLTPGNAPIAAVTDSHTTLFTWSGRSALFLALEALGIQQGDRVLLPNYYCPTMIAPLVKAGIEPVFYPILENRAPDIAWLRNRKTLGARAILAAHFFGLPLDLTELRAYCDSHGMALIEDCAHAFFGSVNGHTVGSWGDVSIASLPKFFPTIQGGALVSGRHDIDSMLAQNGHQGWRQNLSVAWQLAHMSAASERLTGVNFLVNGLDRLRGSFDARSKRSDQITTVFAESPETTMAIALADPLLRPFALTPSDRWTMDHSDLDRLVSVRRRNYEVLSDMLAVTPGCDALFPSLPRGAVPYVFPVFLRAPERAYAALRQHRFPVYRWDRYWPNAISDPNDVGRSWAHHVLQLACHQDLRNSDIESIARVLRANA
jgi:dTDP-4-amino-4,6-dideoxygalactose transaminase